MIDFKHYNRDTAFGYCEDAAGEVSLTIYLGGDNVKEFSILTGGEADVVRLKQLIRGAELEGDHIRGSDKKAEIASEALSSAGIYADGHTEDGSEKAETGSERLKIWLTADNKLEDKLCSTGIELIMDADAIAKRLTDELSLKSIRLVAYSHYGYDNNYTRAHEETEYILEQMIELTKRKAAVRRGDFEIIVESVVKTGLGDKPGVITDPEEQTFGAYYSYSVRGGELCISEINCDKPDSEYLICPECKESISYDSLKHGLKNIADEGACCPYCKKMISASRVRRGIKNGEYFFRKRDLMPVYISQDDAYCIGFLGEHCSEERAEKYLQQAIREERHNCIAALLNYKKTHFEKAEQDAFGDLGLDDDWDDDTDEDSKSSENFGNEKPGLIPSDDGELVFGHYGRKKEPIRWRILSIVDNEALIITSECIDCRSYHKNYEKITWEQSSMRQWLNEEFLAECFSDEEREHILPTPIPNPDNYFNRVSGGNDTIDKAFLLNIDEAEFYFDDRFKRQALAGKEALEKRAYVAGTGFTAWWLRTPGSDEVHASNVDYYGIAYNIGFLVNYTSNCMRPAMWIKL